MKKQHLPDSLELLLDTMCNTFGGIMFIAISLVVISQLVSRAQLSMTPEEAEESGMEQLRQKIHVVQSELLHLERQKLELQFHTNDDSPEKEKCIRDYRQAKIKNLQTASENEALAIRIESELTRLERRINELKSLREELEKKKQEIHRSKEDLQKQIRQHQTQIAELEQQSKKLPDRALRFAMEESTDLKPYWILLHRNKVYLAGTGDKWNTREVEVRDSGQKIELIPRNGTELNNNSKAELAYLFRTIDKNHYFISLITDHDSSDVLIRIKQYLRTRGFRTKWWVDPNYELIRSSNVNYRASE